MKVWMVLLWSACSPRTVELTGSTGIDPTVPTVVSSEGCESCGGDCLVEELFYDQAFHTTDPVDYQDRPPAGGPHNPCWAAWGVHDDAVEDDRFVHNLEHGGVVTLYACDDCPDDVALLTELTDGRDTFALLTPYTDMEARVAVVAWGWRLTAGCVDPDAFDRFYEDHVDQAPESVAAGPSASCM